MFDYRDGGREQEGMGGALAVLHVVDVHGVHPHEPNPPFDKPAGACLGEVGRVVGVLRTAPVLVAPGVEQDRMVGNVQSGQRTDVNGTRLGT